MRRRDQGVALQGTNISPPLRKEKNPQKFLFGKGDIFLCQEGFLDDLPSKISEIC